ncbi:hypothetical protein Tco_0226086 [Tanacetum coccineum]
MRKINFKKAVTQKFREYDQKLEAVTNFNVFEAFKKVVQAKVLTEMKKLLPTRIPKAVANYVRPRINTSVLDIHPSTWSHDNQDPPNNREIDTPVIQPLDQEDEYVQIHPNPEWFPKKSGSANAKRRTTWFDLLLKSDIYQNENHILGPSTVTIAKKIKAIIQKDELTIADLEGAGLERLKQYTKEKYTTSITKHYAARYYKQGIEDMISDRWSKETHRYIFEALNGIYYWEDSRIDFFKAEMSTRTEGNVYSDLRKHLLTKEKYTTSITKHYAARYYKQGIEDMISDRWSKETHRYIFETLNGIYYWEDSRIDFFKAEMSTRTEGMSTQI